MHFVLKCTIDPEFLYQEFERPITNQLFVGLEAEIVAAFEGTQADCKALNSLMRWVRSPI